MEHATSNDGTRIAFNRFGTGRPVVIVNGALAASASAEPLAEACAEAGMQGVTYDRRGRGDSGDTEPYAPQREAEDLHAVISATGGDAVVLGHSSGAVLALLAAADGVPMSHLFLSEPPFRFGGDAAAHLAERLQELVDGGENDQAIVLFLGENVGLPEPVIEAIRQTPDFESMTSIAQTTVYDTRLVDSVSTPTTAMLTTTVPTTILRGEPTFPILVTAATRLAAAMNAELVVVPESRNHSLDPKGTAREMRARLG